MDARLVGAKDRLIVVVELSIDRFRRAVPTFLN